MTSYATPPISPFLLTLDASNATLEPQGSTLVRRMSDLGGLFADVPAWERAVADGDPIVYTVVSSPVPEIPRELPQSVTTIHPGTIGGEFWMTKGHQHPDPQGEIYLGLGGCGGLLLFDGERTEWLEITPGVVGYIPPGWAHRSVNIGDEPYRFLAVYPGSAGHDYGWVLKHGMGLRARKSDSQVELVPFTPTELG
ncbi:glucose-6-phosphate isomerase family protein [Micromonospora echinaurantiaca]|uniref:glucose-6-phosphate isomerase family protein n=1 Tax=Micromonospora echinaurantiaca TaxID=47857 RepID=UPI0037AD4F69